MSLITYNYYIYIYGNTTFYTLSELPETVFQARRNAWDGEPQLRQVLTTGLLIPKYVAIYELSPHCVDNFNQ